MRTTLSVTVIEVPEDVPLSFREWLRRRLHCVPRKGGVALRDGCDEVVCASWSAADNRMWAKIRLLVAQASESSEPGQPTATSEYLLDLAKRWSLMRDLVRANRFRLWPLEADDAA
jgi:hypothetical protein